MLFLMNSDDAIKTHEQYAAQPHIAAIYAARAIEEAANRAKLLKAFETAARKADKLVASGTREELVRAIAGLERRTDKAELRGHEPSATACYARISTLRASLTAVHERNLRERAEAREAEHAALRAAREARIAGLCQYEIECLDGVPLHLRRS